MSNYFENFPKTDYDILKDGTKRTSVNILLRFRVLEKLAPRSTIYYQYDVQDGDRPDTIAAKYYGDSNLDWLVMIVNNIFNVDYDWPMEYTKFRKFIVSKYGSLAASQSEVHHREQILRALSYTTVGEKLNEIAVEVDQTTYDSLAPTSRREVTAYDQEVRLNDARRSIKILDKNYLARVLDEVEDILR